MVSWEDSSIVHVRVIIYWRLCLCVWRTSVLNFFLVIYAFWSSCEQFLIQNIITWNFCRINFFGLQTVFDFEVFLALVLILSQIPPDSWSHGGCWNLDIGYTELAFTIVLFSFSFAVFLFSFQCGAGYFKILFSF